MSEPTEQVTVNIYNEKTVSRVSETIIRERPVEILLNGKRLVTIACAGIHLQELAVGYLRSIGMIKVFEDIGTITVSPDSSQVDILTTDPTLSGPPSLESVVLSSGSRTGQPETRKDQILSDVSLSARQVIAFMDELLTASELHRMTHGTHCSALADAKQLLVSRDDIGRHNTIDMLGGYALLSGIDCSDKIIVKTGRISSEIARKVWTLGIPIVVSHSVPTSEALGISREAGITLIGHVRGETFKVYTNERRVRF